MGTFPAGETQNHNTPPASGSSRPDRRSSPDGRRRDARRARSGSLERRATQPARMPLGIVSRTTMRGHYNRAMVNGAHVLVNSTNPEADRAFFRDVLQFASVDAGGGWLIFALPPAEAAF